MAKRTASAAHRPGRLSDNPAVAAPPARTFTPSEAPLASTSPSPRITRSAAKLAAETPSTPGTRTDPPPTFNPSATSQPRKRKATTRRDKDCPKTDQEAHPTSSSPPRRTKRPRTTAQTTSSLPGPRTRSPAPRKTRRQAEMSQSGSSSRQGEDQSKPPKQKSVKARKPSQDTGSNQVPNSEHSKKQQSKGDSDITMNDADDIQNDSVGKSGTRMSSPNLGGQPSNNSSLHERDSDDPFRNHLFGSRSPLELQSTLRALSGMMSGISSRLRDILVNLRMKEDPSIQLIALQELSDLLLVSNEDTLAGQFSSDSYVKELVSLMEPGESGEENPEIMLLACRCLANLMEAIRGSVTNVVYGGAVPVLCRKLLDIQFIDLAEQALSTLAKISVDFPSSIVREGGLTACLTYLDFFPTSTQRTAVTTAANCCRNLPTDSFNVVKDVMPTLLHVLSSSDQKVMEQGCLCVCRVVESFKYKPEKLEELIKPDMLRAILRLLLPGTTNLIGSHIHTQFLRVLAITCRSSPQLSMELLKMDVVDTLYQILTGVSPPSNLNDGLVKIDSVHIMQALIHRPREQIYETLNVICELLPNVQDEEALVHNHVYTAFEEDIMPYSSSRREKLTEKRVGLLKSCQNEMKRFATILLPTLTDAYSSTVNFGVRQKVLLAQLKMLQYLDVQIIQDALRNVPYASFLAAILSQDDHLLLVALALRCAELLFKRLREIYQYQFHREGVISEVTKFAERPLPAQEHAKKLNKPAVDIENENSSDDGRNESHTHDRSEPHDNDGDSDEYDDYHETYIEDHDNVHDHDNISESDDSSASDAVQFPIPQFTNEKLVVDYAKDFLQLYESTKGIELHDKAFKGLQTLKSLVLEIASCYRCSKTDDGYLLFQRLSSYFCNDAIDSITSAELLNSGVIQTLLDVIGDGKMGTTSNARTDFLRAFMAQNNSNSSDTAAPFGILIHKLQDLLSRTEHFEVITVHHNSYESRNTSSMLSKQIRLRILAEDESDIPKSYRNMMVSIHAIANFKALDEYLRPRIALSERPRSKKTIDPILSQPGSSSRTKESSSDGRALHSTDKNKEPTPTRLGSSRARKTTHASKTSDNTKAGSSTSPQTGPSGNSKDRSSRSSRRSTRRQPPPPPPPALDDESEASDEPLECVDERRLAADNGGDDDEDDEDVGGPLDAIVDDLDGDMSEASIADPTAVNMEVASSGKVTARRDDGTQIPTPSQSASTANAPSTSASSAAQALRNSLALAGRPFSSYAAAMASIPQDWHIEFSIDGKPITHDTTIYRAIHHKRNPAPDSYSGSVWSNIHTIRFKRVRGPPPSEPSRPTTAVSQIPESEDNEELPESLMEAATTAAILRLLRVLHRLNSQLDDILAETKEPLGAVAEPLAQFINTKLTAKLNRQLEEPLIVASNCLPSWSEDLARHFPFLFPFETRHLFLQSTSFGYARSMVRWQGSQSADDNRNQRREDRPFSRLQRQKVRISRTRILESAMKVMELYGSSSSVLEVEYFEEVGTGLGPTLEFYSTVSKEFCKTKLNLWREHDTDGDEYVYSKRGLFPAPLSSEQLAQDSGKKILGYFKGLGKFVARSMLDSRIVDIAFNPMFFRISNNLSTFKPSIGAIKAVDPELANSLLTIKQFADVKSEIKANSSLTTEQKAHDIQACEVGGVKIEDMGLDFTLPGYPSIQLLPNGANVPVTMENVDLYVDTVLDMTLGGGVCEQLEAFRSGFSQVFSYSALRAFTANELAMLFGQVEEDWTIETLMDSMKADHGFNMDSRSVRNLLETMSQFDLQQRRDFLQFVTGSPKLPIGGFKSLTPMFTVVCRPSEPPYTSDDYLPSVMTCVNYLKLPDYTSAEILRKQLDIAMREGQGAFHLS